LKHFELSCPSNVAGVWASNHSDPLGSIASRWHHQLPLSRRSGQGIHQFFRHVPAQKFTELGSQTDNTFSSFVTTEKNRKQNDNDDFLLSLPGDKSQNKRTMKRLKQSIPGDPERLGYIIMLADGLAMKSGA